jgi:hypothetical protein
MTGRFMGGPEPVTIRNVEGLKNAQAAIYLSLREQAWDDCI